MKCSSNDLDNEIKRQGDESPVKESSFRRGVGEKRTKERVEAGLEDRFAGRIDSETRVSCTADLAGLPLIVIREPLSVGKDEFLKGVQGT